jgi:two-component system phosphate regulon sensor histidine kinase PhoR
LPGITQPELAGHGRVATVPLPDVCINDQIYEPILRPGMGGGLLRSVMALRNVTLRRREEARRIDFFSKIAHDLRSPMSAMLTRTELALAGKHGLLSAQMLADMRSMQRNIREMVAMINDLLELTRYEGRGYDLELEPASLNELVESVVEDIRPLAAASALELFTNLPAEPVVLLCDTRRIRQVLNNLLGNAIKFTPANGRVCVELARHEEFVEVSVKDTGKGIEPMLLDRIFDRYVRAIDDQHAVIGTGLGLMIVREIVELHGGSVGVTSEPGVGSTFWFRLPSSHSDLEFRAQAG